MSDKPLSEYSEQELKEYGEFIEDTLLSLKRDLASSTSTKVNQAEMRLPLWRQKERELEDFLKNKQQ